MILKKKKTPSIEDGVIEPLNIKEPLTYNSSNLEILLG